MEQTPGEGPGRAAIAAAGVGLAAASAVLFLTLALGRRIEALEAPAKEGPDAPDSRGAAGEVIRETALRRELAELRREAERMGLEARVLVAGRAASGTSGHGLVFDMAAAERAVEAVLEARAARFREESAARWRSRLMQAVPKYVEQLHRVIPLSPDQRKTIEAILAEGYAIEADAMAAAPEPGIAKYGLTDLRADCERKVRAALTEEQLKRFETFDKSWLPGWGKN
jgi:hypothetical protein